MRELNISGVDLNLLPPLAALLDRRSVTQAARDTGLSQPAMSRALARLRALLGDELLVRTGRGFVLTPRAAALQPQLEASLAGVRALLNPVAFDPATAARTIRVAASDSFAVLLAPPLLARLARDAPGIDLRIEPYSADLPARVESGRLDLVLATGTTPLPPGAMSQVIAHDRLALVMRRGHPAAGADWTIADYGRWHHVSVAMLGDGQSEIDALLAAAGIRRRIALVTPGFTAALAAVAETDLVTTISADFAARFAERFNLELKPPPFAAGLDITIVWSHLRSGDPVLAWFRTVLAEVAATPLA
jgi:DNA-binding transcriptional LysR family regulator